MKNVQSWYISFPFCKEDKPRWNYGSYTETFITFHNILMAVTIFYKSCIFRNIDFIYILLSLHSGLPLCAMVCKGGTLKHISL